MPYRIRIQFGQADRQPSTGQRFFSAVSGLVSAAVVVGLIILLAPIIGAVLAVLLGFALIMLAMAGLWWLFVGKKMVRRMQDQAREQWNVNVDAGQAEEASDRPGERPRKKVDARKVDSRPWDR